jgi:hypothetical protein
MSQYEIKIWETTNKNKIVFQEYKDFDSNQEAIRFLNEMALELQSINKRPIKGEIKQDHLDYTMSIYNSD